MKNLFLVLPASKWLKQYPVEKVILSTGYLSESIEDYFGTSFDGIPIEYVVEEKPLGTGGRHIVCLTKTKAKTS